MSGFNEKNARSSDRLTVAGFAAVIVVGVFVVCVILILAKSLFPSNEPEVSGEVNTATIGETSAPEVTAPPETSSVPAIVEESKPDSSSEESSSGDESSHEEKAGEMMYLSQTAYLRSAGNENAEPLLSIMAGEQVEVIESNAEGYVHVKYYTYDGWVWNEYLYN